MKKQFPHAKRPCTLRLGHFLNKQKKLSPIYKFWFCARVFTCKTQHFSHFRFQKSMKICSQKRPLWTFRCKGLRFVMQCERPLWYFGLYCVPNNNSGNGTFRKSWSISAPSRQKLFLRPWPCRRKYYTQKAVTKGNLYRINVCFIHQWKDDHFWVFMQN